MYGYQELIPPSTWMVPGTVVWLAPDSSYRPDGSAFKPGIVCTAEQNLGPDFKPYESETIARQLKKEKSFNIHLDLDIASVAAINSKLEFIDTVTVNLTNVHLFEMSDWQMGAYGQKRDPDCTKAIRARLARGYKVAVISSALQADATYQVEWSQVGYLTVKSKIDALRALAADIGVEAKNVTTSGFSANKLIWGVKGDEWLLVNSIPIQG
jgi:hypothetical protein